MRLTVAQQLMELSGDQHSDSGGGPSFAFRRVVLGRQRFGQVHEIICGPWESDPFKVGRGGFDAAAGRLARAAQALVREIGARD
jgi:hypothetical protein